MVKIFSPVLTFFVIAAGAKAWAQSKTQEITLTQKGVAELVLKQSLKTEEVNLSFQQYRLDPVKILSNYDWKLALESGYEYDNSLSILSSAIQSNNNKFERYRTTFNLTKPFTTGTNMVIELSRLSQKANFDSFLNNPPPAQQTLDIIGLTLEQSLLGNFLGAADRANVHAARLTYQANSVIRANQLEDLVLQSIRQFWNTYVAQENFIEATNARERYKKLVETVKRKASLGYSNPGDLPQAQAELEAREQKAKSTSADYLAQLENLTTLLQLDPKGEIKFEVPKSVPPVPSLPSVRYEELRDIRSQKLKVAAAEESLTSAKSTSYPTLNLVGKVYSHGVDRNSENSYSELLSGTRPKYYAGIKLQYNFGSDIQNETIINKKMSRDLEETRLRRQLLEAQDLHMQAQRKVESTYAIAISAEKQKTFLEKAYQELNRSYSQGRTDINILITAMNKFFDSEVQYTRAVGDYSIALNEWAALRDELIPEEPGSVGHE